MTLGSEASLIGLTMMACIVEGKVQKAHGGGLMADTASKVIVIGALFSHCSVRCEDDPAFGGAIKVENAATMSLIDVAINHCEASSEAHRAFGGGISVEKNNPGDLFPVLTITGESRSPRCPRTPFALRTSHDRS